MIVSDYTYVCCKGFSLAIHKLICLKVCIIKIHRINVLRNRLQEKQC